LLADAELRARLGRAGREWVERAWTWDRLAGQLAELLHPAPPAG
jgi:phosphatidyl-myo-inositol dimannoside synthase